jgi:hypothetical protein
VDIRAGELLIISEVQSGDRLSSFRPCIVNVKQSSGLRFSTKVAVVDEDEFHKHLLMLPGAVLPAMPKKEQHETLNVIQYTNEELKVVRAVVTQLDGLPPTVKHKVAEMWHATSTEMVELILQKENNLRAGQGQDFFQFAGNSLLDCRPKPLRLENREHVMAWSDWKDKVQQVQADREKQ